MSPLERRVRQLRSRVLARSWGYRQRHLAHGVWFRLRRLLADAHEVHAIPEDEAHKLIAEGARPEPVGRELAPPKLIVFTSAARLAQIANARPLPIGLGAELLAAECLALIPLEVPPPRGRIEGDTRRRGEPA